MAPSMSGIPLLLKFDAEFRTVLVSLIGLEPILLSEGGFEPPASAIPPQGYLVRDAGVEPTLNTF